MNEQSVVEDGAEVVDKAAESVEAPAAEPEERPEIPVRVDGWQYRGRIYDTEADAKVAFLEHVLEQRIQRYVAERYPMPEGGETRGFRRSRTMAAHTIAQWEAWKKRNRE